MQSLIEKMSKTHRGFPLSSSRREKGSSAGRLSSTRALDACPAEGVGSDPDEHASQSKSLLSNREFVPRASGTETCALGKCQVSELRDGSQAAEAGILLALPQSTIVFSAMFRHIIV